MVVLVTSSGVGCSPILKMKLVITPSGEAPSAIPRRSSAAMRLAARSLPSVGMAPTSVWLCAPICSRAAVRSKRAAVGIQKFLTSDGLTPGCSLAPFASRLILPTAVSSSPSNSLPATKRATFISWPVLASRP